MGVGGRGGGGIITGSDGGETTLLAVVSFMSETEKDSQRQSCDERGTVRAKEAPGNHLKAL